PDVTQEAHQARLALLLGDLVGANLCQAEIGFGLAQTDEPRIELLQDGIDVSTSLSEQVRDILCTDPVGKARWVLNGILCFLGSFHPFPSNQVKRSSDALFAVGLFRGASPIQARTFRRGVVVPLQRFGVFPTRAMAPRREPERREFVRKACS